MTDEEIWAFILKFLTDTGAIGTAYGPTSLAPVYSEFPTSETNLEGTISDLNDSYAYDTSPSVVGTTYPQQPVPISNLFGQLQAALDQRQAAYAPAPAGREMAMDQVLAQLQGALTQRQMANPPVAVLFDPMGSDTIMSPYSNPSPFIPADPPPGMALMNTARNTTRATPTQISKPAPKDIPQRQERSVRRTPAQTTARSMGAAPAYTPSNTVRQFIAPVAPVLTNVSTQRAFGTGGPFGGHNLF